MRKVYNCIPWLGGKSKGVRKIVPMIQYCCQLYKLKGFIEPTGGGCKMLLNLPFNLFSFRIYNDIDYGLSSLFAYLSTCNDLDLFLKYAYAYNTCITDQEIYEEATKIRLDEHTDRLKAAALTYVTAQKAYYCDASKIDRIKENKISLGKVKKLYACMNILKGIGVTNGDFRDLLEKYSDREDYFVYLDPPYIYKIKQKQDYVANKGEYPFTRQTQIELVEMVLKSKMKIMISGYDNDIYQRLEENGWHKYALGKITSTGKELDYIWCNFEVPLELL